MCFRSLFELLQTYNTEEKCQNFFINNRWKNGITCPYCGEHKIYKLGKGIFRCSNCFKEFSVRTKTYMEHSRIPYQKWLMAIYLITSHKKGLSSIQLAKDIGVTQKTAWFILQRLNNIVSPNLLKLSNIVEVDEMYVGGAEKNKHKYKRTMNSNKIHGDKSAILGMIERNGNLVLRDIEKVNKSNIMPLIEKHIDIDAIVNTDESPIYKGALNGRERKQVNHNKGIYGIGDITTNRIEGVFSHFQKMVSGIFIHLSKQHIERYANMFCFRMNTRKLDEFERINVLLNNVENTRIMYKVFKRC